MPMTPERWLEIEQLYHAALEQDVERRESFLAEACGTDEDLHKQVTQLLAQNGSTRDLADLTSLWESFGNDLETGTALSAGARLGPYKIVSPLGEGGMGKVYRALDTRLGRAVAVKISTEQFSKRFEREARAISALNHPNICTLYDVGSLPSGAGYMVTELVEGETLRDWLKHSPALDRSVAVIRQVIEALCAAHDAGIVHRDLKPANIMVRFDGYVKVLDFGLAKRIRGAGERNSEETATMSASVPGQIVGTVAYMSPEQIMGLEADARSDLFATGIILYEMAAGRHPWPRGSTVDTMHAILHDDPPPIPAPAGGPSLSAASIEHIARRCLTKKPELRFQTMAELGTALQGAAADSVPDLPKKQQSSIAVLPFANMSADKENEYFGDGLAEEIINVLARVPGMKVAGRTSSFFFRGKDIEFGEIGRRLNVEHILEGSIRKAGSRLRVSAQLIKVNDGFHLWSERYDREMTDLFAIQDEITQSIAGSLRIKLSPEGATPRRHVPDLRAYEAFLKAREHLLVRRSPESLTRGKELLELAIQLDPNFALPYSILGVHYTAQAYAQPARELIPLARAAQQEALRVDPSLPEAHAMLGVCAGMEYRWREAEGHWALAMASEPVPRDVLFWYGNHYLLPSGRAVEAVKVESPVLDEDPLNLLYRRLYAIALQHAGRLADAETELRRLLEIDEMPPALGTLGSVFAQQGRFEEALAVTERAHALAPLVTSITGQLAALLVRTGATTRAGALVEKLRSGPQYGASTGLALFHALCGELDQAAGWTERAIEERYPGLVAILGPFLRPSPQWPALAELMNLPRN